jgi:hypothetical protein
MGNEMKSGDIYQLDDESYVLICEEGCVSITTTGEVYQHPATIDSDYLHSMRAVAVCNLPRVLDRACRT